LLEIDHSKKDYMAKAVKGQYKDEKRYRKSLDFTGEVLNKVDELARADKRSSKNLMEKILTDAVLKNGEKK